MYRYINGLVLKDKELEEFINSYGSYYGVEDTISGKFENDFRICCRFLQGKTYWDIQAKTSYGLDFIEANYGLNEKRTRAAAWKLVAAEAEKWRCIDANYYQRQFGLFEAEESSLVSAKCALQRAFNIMGFYMFEAQVLESLYSPDFVQAFKNACLWNNAGDKTNCIPTASQIFREYRKLKQKLIMKGERYE